VNRLLAALGRWLSGSPAAPAAPAGAEAIPDAERARRLFDAAGAEADTARQQAVLRAALACAEGVPGAEGDRLVGEISIALGESLRADGALDDALPHFTRVLERGGADGAGHERRVSVLARLGVLEQQAGRPERARAHYEAALAAGGDGAAPGTRMLLTQAAFNLGLISHESGLPEDAAAHWRRAVELGAAAGGPGGWDPAAIAAFNLGHQDVAAGDLPAARAWFGRAIELGEPAGTPVGLLAACKAAFALAQLDDTAAPLPGGDVAAALARASALGRASGVPEAMLMAGQAELQLGEWRAITEPAAALAHYRSADELVSRCDPQEAGTLASYAPLRLGMALSEAGDREGSLAPLRAALDRGRLSGDERAREIAAQAACNLHRVLCSLERWADADAAIASALSLTSDLGSGLGRALEGAAAYGLAVQRHHQGRDDEASEALRRAARLGRESGVEPGAQVALDALLLAGNIAMKASRPEEAAGLFREALAGVEGTRAPELLARAAQAATHLGHALLALQRPGEACAAYDRALALGRVAGRREGRAAAANAALNRASLALDLEVEQRRALWKLAITLGRASGTTLGADCAIKAEAALAALGE
jgi:tetratricopeptide (TPR) repeat protein